MRLTCDNRLAIYIPPSSSPRGTMATQAERATSADLIEPFEPIAVTLLVRMREFL